MVEGGSMHDLVMETTPSGILPQRRYLGNLCCLAVHVLCYADPADVQWSASAGGSVEDLPKQQRLQRRKQADLSTLSLGFRGGAVRSYMPWS
eukprot:1948568-Rhodomonas_salina.1